MRLLLVFLITGLCLTATAQSTTGNASRLRNFNTDNGYAMKEFDPVSYFNGKPVKGTAKFSYEYRSITYYFANAANMEKFKAAPTKYEPAYGGWDAYSMAVDGKRVKVDPTTYKIIDGKLYLFHNFGGKNHLLIWNKNEKKYKPSADKLWIAKMH